MPAVAYGHVGRDVFDEEVHGRGEEHEEREALQSPPWRDSAQVPGWTQLAGLAVIILLGHALLIAEAGLHLASV